jgi:hypothetical protein
MEKLLDEKRMDEDLTLSLLQTHFSDCLGGIDGNMNASLRTKLCSEAETYFTTSFFQGFPLASMTKKAALGTIIKEIQESPEFSTCFKAFVQDLREKMPPQSWTPLLEYEMSRPSTKKYILLLQLMGTDWRSCCIPKVPLLLGQPFKLRESKDLVESFSSSKNSFQFKFVWIRNALTREWCKASSPSNALKEPEEFKAATHFVSAPSSKNILALAGSQVLVGRLGEANVFAKFDHGLSEDADFLDCFVLSSGAVVIKIGKRNVLTGGLGDEVGMSFRYGSSEKDLCPHTLSTEEDEEVSSYYSVSRTMLDMNVSLSAKNDLKKGLCTVIHDLYEKKIGLKLACGLLGNQSSYVVVCYDGTMYTAQEDAVQEIHNVDFPVSHVLYQT